MSSVEEARLLMDQLRSVKGKNNIVVEVGRVMWEASGLLVLSKGEIIPNPDIVGHDHGIEPLPFRVRVSVRRSGKS